MNKLISIVIYFPNGQKPRINHRKKPNHIEKRNQIINKSYRQSITKKNSQCIRHIINKMKGLLNSGTQKKKSLHFILKIMILKNLINGSPTSQIVLL